MSIDRHFDVAPRPGWAAVADWLGPTRQTCDHGQWRQDCAAPEGLHLNGRARRGRMMAVADADKAARQAAELKRAPEDDGRGSIYADANTQYRVELWRTDRFKMLNEATAATSRYQNTIPLLLRVNSTSSRVVPV
jgi:hypothetical protein